MKRLSLRAQILTTMTTCILVLGAAEVVSAADDFSYGRNLMTEQQRAEHRTRMRSMDTEEQRSRYRQQVHEEMKNRAAELGTSLPDAPRERGTGLGKPGYGAGPGGGYGRGR